MRSRRTSSEHQEAVARRLAQLSAELEATRGESVARAAGGEWWSDHTRVTAAVPDLRVVPVSAPPEPPKPPGKPPAKAPPKAPDQPPRVPVPGRHAAPRRATRLADVVVPATLRGRVALGPGPLAVVALVVALGMALTAWLVVRGDPEQPTLAAAPAGGEELVALPSSAASPGSASSTPAGGKVTVDVAGKVRRPGIAVLDAGARVVDALEAAGGARAGVDLSTLNLARVLVDGEQILVGATAPESVSAPTPAAPGGAPAPGELVNLNVASVAELETLPEVGPVTAAAIITWRDTNGAFTSVEELLEVDGIGEVTLAQITPYVTV
jgi:competence protein ComEA